MNTETEQRIRQAIDVHRAMLTEFERNGIATVTAIAETIVDSLGSGGTVYVCGNGGSAADAQHVVGELVGRFQTERKALPAVALVTDGAVLTSIANDYGYERTFSRQVEGLVREGDIFWAFSTSGTSPNVVEAAKLAKVKKARVVAFTGRTDSTLEGLADICFCAADNATARCQEIHQLAYHLICDLVERSFTT